MKAPRPIKGILLQGLVFCIFLLAAQTGLCEGADDENGFIEYDTTAAAEVISLQYIVNELAEHDSEPRLRIYGDGTVTVHYGPFMKRSGNYRLQLSRQEMAALFQTVLQHRVLDFDLLGVKQRKADIEKTRRARAMAGGEAIMVHEVADADITNITFRLKRYRPEGSKAGTRRNLEKKITYRGLRTDAEQFPEIQTIAGLAEVEARLRALTERSDLVRIDK